ncbi:MAG: DNA-3-methyladenine glycosylase 2 family protein [Chitinophagales bacterium]
MQQIVNANDIKRLTKLDPVLGKIHKQYGAPPNWSRPQGFEALAKIILEQQVSLASANAHFAKLKAAIDEFTPLQILKLTDEEMRSCQISRQKTRYLRELSMAVSSKQLQLELLPDLEVEEIRHKLTAIKGIGHWTTDVYLLFCLQQKDIFPIGDVAVVNTIKELYSLREKEQMLELAEKWRPLRSLATYFLWHHYLSKRKRTAS